MAAAEKELKLLLAREAEAGVDRERLRTDLLEVAQEIPGTAAGAGGGRGAAPFAVTLGPAGRRQSASGFASLHRQWQSAAGAAGPRGRVGRLTSAASTGPHHHLQPRRQAPGISRTGRADPLVGHRQGRPAPRPERPERPDRLPGLSPRRPATGGLRRATTGATATTLQVWDVAGGKEVSSIQEKGLIVLVVFSPNGQRLAAAGQDGAITVRTG